MTPQDILGKYSPEEIATSKKIVEDVLVSLTGFENDLSINEVRRLQSQLKSHQDGTATYLSIEEIKKAQ